MALKKTLWLCLCALPLVVLYALLERQSLSVPIYDDYSAILAFGLRFHHIQSVSHKLAYVATAQQNEYKLIFEHTIVAIDIATTGSIHFGFLILLGNSLVLAIIWVLWKNAFVYGTEHQILLFAPVCFFIAQLNYAENLDWAMCGLQTFPVLLFSLASIHFLARKQVVAASCYASLAIFSSANGFFVVPIGLAIFICARNWRGLMTWLGVTALSTAVYVYGYTPHRYPSISAGLVPRVLFLASFAGAAVENMHHRPIPYGAVALGIGILLLFVHASWNRLWDTNPFLFYMALWCLMSGVAVEYGRMWAGFTASLIPRYKVYSDLLLAFSYLYLIITAQRLKISSSWTTRLFLIALATSIVVASLGDYLGYGFLVRRRSLVQEGLSRYQMERTFHLPAIKGEAFGGAEPELDKQILDQAINDGLFQLPVGL